MDQSSRYLTMADILQFDFERQTANYTAIQKALFRNKLRLQEMELDYIAGHGRAAGRTFVTFKAFAADRNIAWHKYECGAHGAGQNHIIIFGRRMKVSEFLGLSVEKQDELLASPTAYNAEKSSLRESNIALGEVVKAKLQAAGFVFKLVDGKSSKRKLQVAIYGKHGETMLRQQFDDAAVMSRAYLDSNNKQYWQLTKTEHALCYAGRKLVEARGEALASEAMALLGEGWTAYLQYGDVMTLRRK